MKLKTARKINEGIGNSDVVRRLQGYHGKGKSAARLGRLAIELTIHRIDMIKKLDNLEKKDVDDLLLKLRKELVSDLVAIKNFEKDLK